MSSISRSTTRASSSICLNLLSLMMSSFQPVSWEARRTFWPLRPIASDSFSSGTTSSMRWSASSTMTLFTSAGWMSSEAMLASFGKALTPRKIGDHLVEILTDARHEKGVAFGLKGETGIQSLD